MQGNYFTIACEYVRVTETIKDDKYFIVVQYVFLPDACHILGASSGLRPRSFGLTKQTTRAQSDMGQNRGALNAVNLDPDPRSQSSVMRPCYLESGVCEFMSIRAET